MKTTNKIEKSEAEMNADYAQMLSALRAENFPEWMEQVGNTFVSHEEAAVILGNEILSRKGDDDFRSPRWENLVSTAKRVLNH